MLFLLTYNDSSEFFIHLISGLEFLFILSGISVIITKNPIVSILFLISLFLEVSIYLILIGINFIGITYLLVYVGAVSILFLFILMLIDIRISELHVETMNNVVLAVLLGIFLLLPLMVSNNNFNLLNIYNDMFNTYSYLSGSDYSDKASGYVSYIYHNTWEGSVVENIDITVIGNILYTNISLWLIISLLILLLAMVGAIVINLDIKAKNTN